MVQRRWAEIGYTRYSVIFTGEVLPDGNQADAVYTTVLNPPYRDLLNQVEMRPLDYDYSAVSCSGLTEVLRASKFFKYLAPSQVEGQEQKLVYSSYCQHAPQMRYLDFEHVKEADVQSAPSSPRIGLHHES